MVNWLMSRIASSASCPCGPSPGSRAAVDLDASVIGTILFGNKNKFSQCEKRDRAEKGKCHAHRQGAGIPQEAQAFIFEPFRQVDDSATRQHGGSGLGLAIVKQLSVLMGGEVVLESQPGHGSKFTVFLPIMTEK
jgi:signal transduction histidine kinase